MLGFCVGGRAVWVAAVSALGARAHLDEDMGLGELQQACELAIRLGTVPGMDRALNKWYEQHLDPAKAALLDIMVVFGLAVGGAS